MTALEYLVSLPFVPMWLNGDKAEEASNSQKRRWLQDKAVIINGSKPGPNDPITLPIEQLVFFPNNPKKRCTML